MIGLGFIYGWFVRHLNTKRMNWLAIITAIDIVFIDIVWLSNYTNVKIIKLGHV